MFTIRGRILIAFLLLSILAGPLIYFSIHSLEKVNHAKDLREKVVIFNVNRLKAYTSFSNVLDQDFRNVKFYKDSTTFGINEFYTNTTSGKEILFQLNGHVFESNNVIEKRVNKLKTHLLNFELKFKETVQNQLTRGYRDYGTEGEMRSIIHEIEENSGNISIAEILSIRRREKDYFLRNDTIYVNLLKVEIDTLKKRLQEDLENNSPVLAKLDAYHTLFKNIVSLETKIGNQESGLISEINTINQNLDTEATKLYDIISEDYNMLISNITTYLTLLSILTLVFGILFAILFSSFIAKPINDMIEDMTEFSRRGFRGKKQLSSKTNIKEIKQLTRSYNQVINKIRSQINVLNKKNYELNSLNYRLLESEKELKDASKLKDKFFSIISHDLRGHTGNVLSLAQILNQDESISEQEKSVFTKYLIDSSQNLQLLLDNLLNWAKSQMNDHEISKRSFYISNLITHNIELFQENALRKGVSITYDQSLNPKVYADKNMIDFVIRNLLSNALKFTSKGDHILFSIAEKQHNLEIVVKDTGVGMTPDQIEKLLNTEEDSFTTNGTNNEKGTGLGFSICLDFITRNNGNIKINSEKGKGSEFIFTIPKTLSKDTVLFSLSS
ncbi:hypothetical protein GCM10011414_14550 [Croceivirga lutea]|uniref:sensor histidine kinase n=1 Tax=Croceivirga lutea TaxID=1775167 RepID=UPI00163A5E82|nr:HAMP domain-containing sensor histidine kinase [Croceivirga lutea]GGG46033.1 hypothetical protein GCM10011414_14550 [Croceivirga lutea]